MPSSVASSIAGFAENSQIAEYSISIPRSMQSERRHRSVGMGVGLLFRVIVVGFTDGQTVGVIVGVKSGETVVVVEDTVGMVVESFKGNIEG